MDDEIRAPFSDAQVESFNEYQVSGISVPFTCRNDSSHPPLVARNEGWVCTKCNYTQQSAEEWMADYHWAIGF